MGKVQRQGKGLHLYGDTPEPGAVTEGDRRLERARAGESKTSSRLSRSDLSSGRRGGLRSGTNRAKGRTYEQLYNEARELNVAGRSGMNKEQLQRAVARHSKKKGARS